jgi:hypothetical protein
LHAIREDGKRSGEDCEVISYGAVNHSGAVRAKVRGGVFAGAGEGIEYGDAGVDVRDLRGKPTEETGTSQGNSPGGRESKEAGLGIDGVDPGVLLAVGALDEVAVIEDAAGHDDGIDRDC